jgi:hypothetical protein
LRAFSRAGLHHATAVYTARAILHGKGGDVWQMMAENIP